MSRYQNLQELVAANRLGATPLEPGHDFYTEQDGIVRICPESLYEFVRLARIHAVHGLDDLVASGVVASAFHRGEIHTVEWRSQFDVDGWDNIPNRWLTLRDYEPTLVAQLNELVLSQS